MSTSYVEREDRSVFVLGTAWYQQETSRTTCIAGPSKVATAAIRGWSLLLSTVPAWRMTTSRVEMSLQVPYLRIASIAPVHVMVR